MPGPISRTPAFSRAASSSAAAPALMPPSAPSGQGSRQHSGRRAAAAAITGSMAARVTMPAPDRRAPSAARFAAPR